jgi:hypothetical protein
MSAALARELMRLARVDSSAALALARLWWRVRIGRVSRDALRRLAWEARITEARIARARAREGER